MVVTITQLVVFFESIILLELGLQSFCFDTYNEEERSYLLVHDAFVPSPKKLSQVRQLITDCKLQLFFSRMHVLQVQRQAYKLRGYFILLSTQDCFQNPHMSSNHIIDNDSACSHSLST